MLLRRSPSRVAQACRPIHALHLFIPPETLVRADSRPQILVRRCRCDTLIASIWAALSPQRVGDLGRVCQGKRPGAEFGVSPPFGTSFPFPLDFPLLACFRSPASRTPSSSFCASSFPTNRWRYLQFSGVSGQFVNWKFLQIPHFPCNDGCQNGQAPFSAPGHGDEGLT